MLGHLEATRPEEKIGIYWPLQQRQGRRRGWCTYASGISGMLDDGMVPDDKGGDRIYRLLFVQSCEEYV